MDADTVPLQPQPSTRAGLGRYRDLSLLIVAILKRLSRSMGRIFTRIALSLASDQKTPVLLAGSGASITPGLWITDTVSTFV